MHIEALHIVLADDNKADRMLFKEALQELKIKTIVHTVNDGVELMDYLTKKDTLIPALLFLDINMPRKNGLECLKEIRSMEKLKEVAIAIFSTSSSEKDIDETFHNGANVYIKKPDDFELLKEVLNKVVSASYMYLEAPFSIENFLLKI